MMIFLKTDSFIRGFDEPKAFRGQTGAQDNIIPTMDIFSGVIAHYPENDLTRYLMDLRSYRPKCIQQFLEDLRKIMFQKPLVGTLKNQNNQKGAIYLLELLEEIYLFRNGHWQFVQKYIMQNTAYPKAKEARLSLLGFPIKLRQYC